MCYIKLFRKNLALLKTEGRWVGYEAFMNLDFFPNVPGLFGCGYYFFTASTYGFHSRIHLRFGSNREKIYQKLKKLYFCFRPFFFSIKSLVKCIVCVIC